MQTYVLSITNIYDLFYWFLILKPVIFYLLGLHIIIREL